MQPGNGNEGVDRGSTGKTADPFRFLEIRRFQGWFRDIRSCRATPLDSVIRRQAWTDPMASGGAVPVPSRCGQSAYRFPSCRSRAPVRAPCRQRAWSRNTDPGEVLGRNRWWQRLRRV